MTAPTNASEPAPISEELRAALLNGATALDVASQDCPTQGRFYQNQAEMIRDHALSRRSQAQAGNDECRRVLQRFVNAAKSWHTFHHGSKTVQCDWICELIAPGEAALAPTTTAPPGEKCGTCGEHANEHGAIGHEFNGTGQQPAEAVGEAKAGEDEVRQVISMLETGLAAEAVHGTTRKAVVAAVALLQRQPSVTVNYHAPPTYAHAERSGKFIDQMPWREQPAQPVEQGEWLKPELPPFPPSGEGLPRYGLRWNGPDVPLSVPILDGYWTPWHLADRMQKDYEEALADHRRLVRELDVLLHGDGAARQASLCDIVAQVASQRTR